MALEEAAKIPDILEAAGVADLLEHTLYNAALPGLSLDGQNYFYRNPLSDSGIHRRSPWFGVARCPPNAARLLASLPGYFYGVSDDGVWVHLYAEGTAEVRLDDDRTVGLRQRTHYPWDGNVEIEVDGENDFSLMLRIPAWCEEGAAIEINGDPFDGSVSPGSYAEIRRAWRPVIRCVLRYPCPLAVWSATHMSQGTRGESPSCAGRCQKIAGA